MKLLDQSLRANVREFVKTRGEFTRQDVYAAFPDLDPRTRVGPAFDSLVKKTNPDRCVVCVRQDSKRDGESGRKWWRVYRYVGVLPAEGSFALPPKGSTNRGGLRNKVHAQVQHKPAGYAPRHFTEPFRAPSELLPDGFPPRFPWDGKPRFYTPIAPIAQLQATLRRPMAREAA
jgi:hypothetical protein